MPCGLEVSRIGENPDRRRRRVGTDRRTVGPGKHRVGVGAARGGGAVAHLQTEHAPRYQRARLTGVEARPRSALHGSPQRHALRRRKHVPHAIMEHPREVAPRRGAAGQHSDRTGRRHPESRALLKRLIDRGDNLAGRRRGVDAGAQGHFDVVVEKPRLAGLHVSLRVVERGGPIATIRHASRESRGPRHAPIDRRLERIRRLLGGGPRKPTPVPDWLDVGVFIPPLLDQVDAVGKVEVLEPLAIARLRPERPRGGNLHRRRKPRPLV